MKRILLFLATNLAIMLLLGIVLNLLGINSILDAQGSDLDLGKLLVLSAVVGFTGSLLAALGSLCHSVSACGRVNA